MKRFESREPRHVKAMYNSVRVAEMNAEAARNELASAVLKFDAPAGYIVQLRVILAKARVELKAAQTEWDRLSGSEKQLINGLIKGRVSC